MIKNFKDIDKTDTNIFGGKAVNLGILIQSGFLVPDGFCVSVDGGDFATELSQLKGKEFAIRSSATSEDSIGASFAGQYDTFLNIQRKDVLKYVKKCQKSLNTKRAQEYRKIKNITKAKMAVVVQEMIQSEVAGISFTVHPVTKDKNQMIIEACWGLGEAIVSGLITPDSYVINIGDWSIIDVSINVQKKMLIRDEKNGANKWVDVISQKQDKQILANKKIIELAKICKKIENHYQMPQDIEWALEKNKFYITQSRPITTL